MTYANSAHKVCTVSTKEKPLAILQTGDVVTVTFTGATGTKRRPAIVVSSDVYHQTRPDVIAGLLTTNLLRQQTQRITFYRML